MTQAKAEKIGVGYRTKLTKEQASALKKLQEAQEILVHQWVPELIEYSTVFDPKTGEIIVVQNSEPCL